MRFTPEIKVGILVIAASAATLFLSLRVADTSLFGDGASMKLYADFDSVVGLTPKAKVRMSGVEIGRVQAILLRGSKARVVIALDRPLEIPIDVTASILTAGLLGERYLELSIPIDSTDRYLADGDAITNTVSPTDLSALVNRSTRVLDLLVETMTTFRDIFGSKEDQEKLRSAMIGFSTTAENMSGIIADNRASIEKLFVNMEGATANLNRLMGALGELGEGVARGKGTVGKLITDDEIYEKLNKTLDSASALTGTAAASRFNIYAEGFNNEALGTVGYNAGVRFFTREDRFFLVGASDDRRERLRKKREKIEREDFDDILFTAQMAKRYWNLTGRIGMFESSFGVGLDYHLFRDKLELSLDLFNFDGYDDESPRSQARLAMRWGFYRYLYLLAGADEIFNERYRTVMFGFGARFDDEDIKSAISLARF